MWGAATRIPVKCSAVSPSPPISSPPATATGIRKQTIQTAAAEAETGRDFPFRFLLVSVLVGRNYSSRFGIDIVIIFYAIAVKVDFIDKAAVITVKVDINIGYTVG